MYGFIVHAQTPYFAIRAIDGVLLLSLQSNPSVHLSSLYQPLRRDDAVQNYRKVRRMLYALNQLQNPKNR